MNNMIIVKSKEFDYEQIALSGQTFRMDAEGNCFALDKHCRVEGNKIICPEKDNDFWTEYFDLKTDYSKFIKAIDKKDEFLLSASNFGRGIRILRQDPWEMLITFIISQRKNIPAIKSSVEAICKRWGSKKDAFYAFPTPKQLAKASLDELRECSLGYRDEYIKLAAEFMCENPDYLSSLEGLSYEALMEQLLKFKGVGVKVANCVALFAYHKIDAFPIDVWISRVLEQYYKSGFPFERYKGFAGVMQQYMFYYIRSNS